MVSKKRSRQKQAEESAAKESTAETEMDLGAVMDGSDPTHVSGPLVEPEPEPEAKTMGILGDAPAPADKPEVAPVPAGAATPRIAQGKAAVDPTQRRGSGPVPMAVRIYCGVAGLRSPVNAGFTAWAGLNGHTMHTRPEWDDLFETYKTSPVRS